jgi:hypothetical protein
MSERLKKYSAGSLYSRYASRSVSATPMNWRNASRYGLASLPFSSTVRQ